MTEPIEFLFGFVLPFGCFSARTCRRLDALSRKDCGLAGAAARVTVTQAMGLLPCSKTPACTKNLDAGVSVMKSTKDAA